MSLHFMLSGERCELMTSSLVSRRFNSFISSRYISVRQQNSKHIHRLSCQPFVLLSIKHIESHNPLEARPNQNGHAEQNA